jgi:S1-C subfamily serine protease
MIEATVQVNVFEAWSSALADVADTVRRSLVQITSGSGRGQGNGAGTIWHSDGLIITNAHVVQRGPLSVTLPDGRKLPARLIAADTDHDIAALSVEATGLPTIEVGDSRQVVPGQWVLAMGHPWGVQGGTTAGTVIGAGAQLPEVLNGKDWIAVNLQLRPGHSGGPLVDAQGRLIGINTLMTGPEVGAAVPVNAIKAFLKRSIGGAEPVQPTPATPRGRIVTV